MVAQLLRLKLRLIANGFRRPVRLWLGGGIALLVGVAIVAVLVTVAPFLRTQDDGFVRRAVIIGGSLLSLSAFVLPVMLTREELLDPRALRGYGFRSGWIALTLLVFSLVGPLLLLAPLAWAPIGVWRDEPSIELATWAAPLLFVQGILSVRLGVAAGAGLRHRPSWSNRVRVVGTLLVVGGALTFLIAILPRVTPILPDALRPVGSVLLRLSAYVKVERIADALEWTPIAFLWAAPSHATFGDPELGRIALAAGAGLVLALLITWFVVVGFAFRATHRIPVERRGGVPAWFRRVPSSPTGAIAARSFIYWVRDPRYRTVFGVLPLLLAGVLIAIWIGGIPMSVGALVPLPLLVILLAWSTSHNDVAYDSSAVWTHVVAQTRGVHDRVGRIVPVLAFGVALILVGAPITAWAHGDWAILPAVAGVSLAILLGGVGVASGFSARFPYAAARPGDSAFQQPQVAGEGGGGAQAGSFFLILLVALPSIAALVLALIDPSFPWAWIGLMAGFVLGLAVLLIGVRSGGATFDRRGPELLAFTMQN